jgi:hypothetical protein
MSRFVVRFALLLVPVLFGLGPAAARADTLTGVFSNPIYAGNVLNYPTYGSTTYLDNTGFAVVGTATPGGSVCAPASTLCWGSGADLGIPASEQYSELSFTGSTTFNPDTGATQTVGTIGYLNGSSDLTSLIFGATLSIYDGGDFLGSYNVIINTTSNQYVGTGLTQQELAIDADYINICGYNSNICGMSIEAYEAGEGGTGLTVDLTGNLVGDPTLNLDTVAVDPSESSCTTCGVVGNEAALGVTPEPPSFVLMSTAVLLFVGFSWRERLRRGAAGGL